MPTPDVNALFARAEQAFGAGRIEKAHRDLVEVSRHVRDHPAVFHLLALVEKRRGRTAEARSAFAQAQRLSPNDAPIAANHANLLSELGDVARAEQLYRRALAIDPAFRDARHNLALMLQRVGRLHEALALQDDQLRRRPDDARAKAARGALLQALDRSDEAAAAFDDALSADPRSAGALHGRARIALERGEPGASALFERALALRGDMQTLLALAEAYEAEGDPRGLALLSAAVERTPDWIEGHELLARMRSEAGAGERFCDHYQAALTARPADRELHLSHWRTLARAGRHADALAALRATGERFAGDADISLTEAVFVSEAGDPADALARLAALDPERPGVRFAHGRVALRAGDPALAASLLEEVVAREPGSVNGWANLDLAWRLLGDARHEWLSGQPGLIGTRDIGLSSAELETLAALLRTLHVTRAHPIGQSLRGGTQTRGALFARREPEIARLRRAIVETVDEQVRGLPAEDPRHPLLRARSAARRFAGSWSVRLKSQGFHVNHIHPNGILSSACYIALPDNLGGTERAGWLDLGAPPVELGLALEPLASVEPRAGRLALFPSFMFHGTRPFASGERLSVAFDIATA